MLIIEITTLAITCFSLGVLTEQFIVHRALRRQATIEATVPLKQLVADFRDFAMNVEGGALSTEAEKAIKVLEEYAKGKRRIEGPRLRPLLEGDALEQFVAEYDAYKNESTKEAGILRAAIRERWHKKGYRFSIDVRKEMMRLACDEETRNNYRKMFDEQDAPLTAAPGANEQ